MNEKRDISFELDMYEVLGNHYFQETAAMREIVEAIAGTHIRRFSRIPQDDTVVYSDLDEYECVFCSGSPVMQGMTLYSFNHEANCPVTKARKLLGSAHAE